MGIGAKLIRENTVAVNELYLLLSNNLSNTDWNNYASGHQERMNNINTVLKSDGGKETVEALIKRIGEAQEKANLEASDARDKDHAYRKKHPFKNFFSANYNEHHQTFHRNMNSIHTLEILRSELAAALRLMNVIELSGLSNKPKLG